MTPDWPFPKPKLNQYTDAKRRLEAEKKKRARLAKEKNLPRSQYV